MLILQNRKLEKTFFNRTRIKIVDHYKSNFETWDKLANNYQEKFMDLELYNDTYNQFCKLIKKKNAAIFEIGCGPGNVTKYLLSQRPDFKIEASDISENMINLAKQNNPAANFRILDCRELDTINNRYDGIMGGFCLPYLSKDDSIKLISDSSNLLNENGIIYLSAIEDNYEKSGMEVSSNGEHKMYVYYHQENYLKEALIDNGFIIEHTFRKEYLKSATSKSTHIIIIARKFTNN